MLDGPMWSNNKLPFRGLQLGMITKLNFRLLAPILNMHYVHEVIFRLLLLLLLAKRLWIVFLESSLMVDSNSL